MHEPERYLSRYSGLGPVIVASWHAMPAPLPFDPIAEAGRQWESHFAERFVAPMEAVTSIMRVQQLLLARLNEALDPYGLTFARYEALMLLYFSRAGALPMGRIGARLQVHPTSVTNLVDRLEQSGYVRRDPHPSDGRTTLAALTDTGRTTAEAATEALHAIEFGLSALDSGALEQLTELLRAPRVDAGDFTPSPR
jgi:DNA-binding MarR family transcriptional regulator